MHEQEANNDGDVTEGIGGKTPALTDSCHQNSRDGWTNNARAIEHRGIECNGIHKVFFADHVDQEGLPAWDIEGVHHSEQTGKQKDMPDLNAAAQRKQGENSSENHGADLGRNYQALAINAVGGDPSEGSKEEDGNLAGKANASQQQSRLRHAVDQPRLRDTLHPGAGQGDELSAEEELKVAVTQGAQGCGPFWRRRCVFRTSFVSHGWQLCGQFVALPLKTFSHLSNDGNPLKAAYGNRRCSRAERIISGYVKKAADASPISTFPAGAIRDTVRFQ